MSTMSIFMELFAFDNFKSNKSNSSANNFIYVRGIGFVNRILIN